MPKAEKESKKKARERRAEARRMNSRQAQQWLRDTFRCQAKYSEQCKERRKSRTAETLRVLGRIWQRTLNEMQSFNKARAARIRRRIGNRLVKLRSNSRRPIVPARQKLTVPK